MRNVKFYTHNIASSALLGCLIGMIYVALLSSGWSDNAVRYGTYGITVLVGFFASAIAIGSALLSIAKQQELIERRHVAARSVLPLTLSKLYKLAENGFETVLDVPEIRDGTDEEALIRFNALQIPSDDVRQIRECIEAADPEVQAWLSLILAHWQLETARLENKLHEKNLIIVSKQLASSAIDWLTIRAMIEHLFDYSRTGRDPSSTLRPARIAAPFLSVHLDNPELEQARSERLHYIEENGGWSFEGFQSRFMSSSDKRDS